MSEMREELVALLADREDLEPAMEELLAVDREGTWTFNDVSLDSGEFGEIAALDIVEKSDGQYRFSDPDLVESVLAGQTGEGFAETEEASPTLWERVNDRTDRHSLGLLVAALCVIVVLRTVFIFRSVFVDGTVVLHANDPFYYRYWVDTLLASDLGAFDPTVLGDLPDRVLDGDILFIVVLWWTAALLGGSSTAVGQVLAWYPVVASVAVGLLVYRTTILLTGDRRVGVAAVLMLAVTPVHAYRAMLGFADHHAFDYVWVGLTMYTLVILATSDRTGGLQEQFDRQTATGVIGLGVAITGQVLSWRGGPLLVTPVALFLVALVVSNARTDRSSERAVAPILLGIGVAAVITAIPHLLWGWTPPFRGFGPTLLLGVSLLIVGLARIGERLDLTSTILAGIITTVIGGTVGTLLLVVPSLREPVSRFLLFFGNLSETVIAERLSLFSPEYGAVFGPVIIFGFVFFLGIAYLGWATLLSYRDHSPAWLVVVVYGWFLFSLSVWAIRFAGSFAVIVAVLAGIGFVHLASVVDLARRPACFDRGAADAPLVSFRIPDRRAVGLLCVLFLLISSMSFVQIPIKQGQLTTDGDTYQSARWIQAHSEVNGFEYPDNYVFSPWSNNRVYNYYVSGEARSYFFARERYGQFVASSNGTGWYERLDGRTGYVVTEDRGAYDESTLQHRLHDSYGKPWWNVSDVTNYRLLYVGPDGSPKVFRLVPGATVTGRLGDGNSSATLTQTISINGTTVEYERIVQTTPSGWYHTSVPYPGTYSVGDARVTVPESAPETGATARGVEATPVSRWSFDEGRGDVAYDVESGYHGRFSNVSRVRTANGSVAAFDGTGHVAVDADGRFNGTGGFTVTSAFRANGTEQPGVLVAKGYGEKSNQNPYDGFAGYQLRVSSTGTILGLVGNGTDRAALTGPQVRDGESHQASLAYNGTHARLALDGQVVDTVRWSDQPRTETSLVIGRSATRDSAFFEGTIDAVQYDTRSLAVVDLPDLREDQSGE